MTLWGENFKNLNRPLESAAAADGFGPPVGRVKETHRATLHADAGQPNLQTKHGKVFRIKRSIHGLIEKKDGIKPSHVFSGENRQEI